MRRDDLVGGADDSPIAMDEYSDGLGFLGAHRVADGRTRRAQAAHDLTLA